MSPSYPAFALCPQFFTAAQKDVDLPTGADDLFCCMVRRSYAPCWQTRRQAEYLATPSEAAAGLALTRAASALSAQAIPPRCRHTYLRFLWLTVYPVVWLRANATAVPDDDVFTVYVGPGQSGGVASSSGAAGPTRLRSAQQGQRRRFTAAEKAAGVKPGDVVVYAVGACPTRTHTR